MLIFIMKKNEIFKLTNAILHKFFSIIINVQIFFFCEDCDFDNQYTLYHFQETFECFYWLCAKVCESCNECRAIWNQSYDIWFKRWILQSIHFMLKWIVVKFYLQFATCYASCDFANDVKKFSIIKKLSHNDENRQT